MRVPKPWIWLFTLIVGARMLPTVWRRAVKKIKGRKPNRFEQSAPRRIPKTIWIYWDSGEDNAPELVRYCIASWRDQNPDWDVHILDAETVLNFAPMPANSGSQSIQAYSDLLRFRLLRKHGGVWVDATAYCLRPLNHWLPLVAYRGFFAFSWIPSERWFIWPGMYRKIGTWFLASEPDGKVISLWEHYSFDYWHKRRKPLVYYWAHIIVDVLRIINRPFLKNFDSMPEIGCYGPHIVHDCVTHGRNPDEVAALLEGNIIPVQKLRWNWNAEKTDMAKKLLNIE